MADTHPSLDDYPIDDDYCGVEQRRATVDEADGEPTDDEAAMEAGYDQESAGLSVADRAFEAAVDDMAVGSVPSETTDRSHRHESGHGSGTNTKWEDTWDETASPTNDGRSQTRTTFYGKGSILRSDGSRVAYSDLSKLNDGLYARERQTQNSWANRMRLIDIFCSYLGCGRDVNERTKYLSEGVEFQELGPYSTDIALLSLISIVANNRGRWIRDEDGFRQLLVDIGGHTEHPLDDVKRCRELLKEKCERF